MIIFKGVGLNLPRHKKIIEDSVYEIPQRLKEYDSSFFILFNIRSGKYEVHSTDNWYSTYCFTVPYDELDSRTLDIVMKNDTKKRGAKEIERELNAHNEKVEKRKDKDFKNWIEDVAKETHSAFKKDIDKEFIGV